MKLCGHYTGQAKIAKCMRRVGGKFEFHRKFALKRSGTTLASIDGQSSSRYHHISIALHHPRLSSVCRTNTRIITLCMDVCVGGAFVA